MHKSHGLARFLSSHLCGALPVRSYAGAVVGPIFLEQNQLPELTKELRNEFPASLNIYHMANNVARKKFAWPGLEFVVDQFPKFSVCLCRTAGKNQKRSIVLDGKEEQCRANDFAANCPSDVAWATDSGFSERNPHNWSACLGNRVGNPFQKPCSWESGIQKGDFARPRLPKEQQIFRNARTKRLVGVGQNLPPLGNELHNVYLFSRNSQALENFLKLDGVIDWSQKTTFMSIRNPVDSTVIRNYCESKGGTVSIPDRYYFEREFFVNTDLTNIKPREDVPDGFRLGILEPEHARQMAEELDYGHSENNVAYFRYLIENGFPSSAVFEEEKGRLVGYAMMRAEFCVGAAHVNPDFRKNGLMKVIVTDLWWKLREMGEESTYGDVDRDNVASLTAMKSMGATVYPTDEDFQGFLYTPGSKKDKKET